MPRKVKYLSNKNILPEIMWFKETGECTEEFGRMLLLLARQISNKQSFIRYNENIKEDMVSFAIVTCLNYSKNFDPEKEKYPNPFAYLTRIIINAFKAYLKNYYKHVNIKQECYDKRHVLDSWSSYSSIDYSELKKWKNEDEV